MEHNKEGEHPLEGQSPVRLEVYADERPGGMAGEQKMGPLRKESAFEIANKSKSGEYRMEKAEV